LCRFGKYYTIGTVKDGLFDACLIIGDKKITSLDMLGFKNDIFKLVYKRRTDKLSMCKG
jgi:hypothetical protein